MPTEPSSAEQPPTLVRTSVVQDTRGWFVRVRLEHGDDQEAVFVGPFPDEATTVREGRQVAQLVRRALGIADA